MLLDMGIFPPTRRARAATDAFLISCHFAVLSDQDSPVSTSYCFNVASTWAHRRLLLGALFAACPVLVLSTSSNTSPTWFSALFVSLLRFVSGECTKRRR